MSELDGLLAGITHLSVNGRGPADAYIFDPHRLAVPCWARAVEERKAPALLLTLDRHFDLVPAKNAPKRGLSVLELDEHARRQLDPRNYDHILGSIEGGLITDVIAVARAKPVGCFEGATYVSADRQAHQLIRVPSLDRLTDDFATPRATPESKQALELINTASHIILDIELDCFTSPSDVDPLTPLPWPESVIREFLCLRDEAFWSAVLPKCSALTLAREPLHCGGLISTNHLFEVAAKLIFVDLLKADLP